MLRLDELKDLDKGKRGHFPYGLNGNESGSGRQFAEVNLLAVTAPAVLFAIKSYCRWPKVTGKSSVSPSRITVKTISSPTLVLRTR